MLTAPPFQRSLDINEVAALFKCNHKTVRRMIAEGALPAVKIAGQWRIRPEHVAEILGVTA